jgi:hypothetical protein
MVRVFGWLALLARFGCDPAHPGGVQPVNAFGTTAPHLFCQLYSPFTRKPR